MNRSAHMHWYRFGASLLLLFATSVHAVQGTVKGSNLEWMEKVRHEENGANPQAIAASHEIATMSKDELASVSPALEKYSQTALADLWKRPGLSPRDRS